MANPKKLLQFSEITFVLNTFKPDKTNLRQNCPTLGAHTFSSCYFFPQLRILQNILSNLKTMRIFLKIS